MYNSEQVAKLIEELRAINEKELDLWLKYQAFTWQWWFSVTISILPWVAWFIWRKKESTWRLLTVGFFIMIVSAYLDLLGQIKFLWYYPIKTIPTIPPFFPWDFAILPVVTMFCVQIKPKLNPFIKAAGYSLSGAFIFQPFMIWIGLYTEVSWRHIYSVPILFAMYMISHLIFYRKNYKGFE